MRRESITSLKGNSGKAFGGGGAICQYLSKSGKKYKTTLWHSSSALRNSSVGIPDKFIEVKVLECSLQFLS